MAGQSIDLTKVNLDGKSIFWMTVAMGAVILMWGVASFGASKVKALTQKTGSIDEFA